MHGAFRNLCDYSLKNLTRKQGKRCVKTSRGNGGGKGKEEARNLICKKLLC